MKITYCKSQFRINIPKSLLDAFELKKGDKMVWRLVNRSLVKLVKLDSIVYKQPRLRTYTICKGGRSLHITFPVALFTSLGWNLSDDIEWKIVRGSLAVQKGLKIVRTWT